MLMMIIYMPRSCYMNYCGGNKRAERKRQKAKEARAVLRRVAQEQAGFHTTNCPPPGLHRFYLQHSNVQLHHHFSITSPIFQLQ
jgi:hypothetical protein